MLTHSHHELLSFIEAFVAEHGFSPSQEEMKSAVGLKSRSGVNRMVNCLEERGYVRRLSHRARAIEVTKRADGAAAASSIGVVIESLRRAIEEYEASGAIAGASDQHWSVIGAAALAQITGREQ